MPRRRKLTDGQLLHQAQCEGGSARLSRPARRAHRQPRHPGPPDKICTNFSSVTFPPSAGGKFTQDFRHGSAEWKRVYADSRNASEGFNGFVKDEEYEDLESPGHRRVGGFARQFMLAALLVTYANYRTIVGIKASAHDATPRPPKPTTRARRRTESTRDLLPDANAPPRTDDPAHPGEAV